MHSGLWSGKWLLSRLQRNDLLRCVCEWSSSALTVENARIGGHCRLVWVGPLSNLILLQLNSVLISIRVTDLARMSLHRHGLLSRGSLIRNRLHRGSVVC